VIFAGNIPGKTQTISLAVYSLLQTPDGDGAAMRLAGISVLLAVAAVLVSDGLSRRMNVGELGT
jgi:molybdate transport system permease protein